MKAKNSLLALAFLLIGIAMSSAYANTSPLDCDAAHCRIENDWEQMALCRERFYNLSPYSYCAGDPINLVDPNGEEPTPYEGALMAQITYDNNLTKEDLPEGLNGWTLSTSLAIMPISTMNSGQNGLQTALFERTVDGVTEYALVFAGTNSINDVVEDFAQIIGLSSQYSSAISEARNLSEQLGDNAELTFIGHSLGGGEATAGSMATGRKAITFNAASVSPLTKFLHKLGDADNVTNYRIVPPGDGKVRMGGCFISNIQDNIGLKAPGQTILIPASDNNPFTAHGIINFVNYLKSRKP